MAQKLSLEQIMFIEKQFNLGKSVRQIVQISDLGYRVVRKYVSIFKKGDAFPKRGRPLVGACGSFSQEVLKQALHAKKLYPARGSL